VGTNQVDLLSTAVADCVADHKKMAAASFHAIYDGSILEKRKKKKKRSHMSSFDFPYELLTYISVGRAVQIEITK